MDSHEKGTVPSSKEDKALSQGRRTFQVVARVGNNAYKLDLLKDYGVSSTFNVSDLSLFEFSNLLDSRTSPFEERGTNVDIERDSPEQGKDKEKQRGRRDLLCDMGGSMTCLRAKQMQQSLSQLVIKMFE